MINRPSIASRICFSFLLVGLAAGLSFAMLNRPVSARAAEPAVLAPGLRIVQSAEDRMVVELDVPAYQLQDVDVTRDNYQRVAVDGALALAVPGKPELPKFSALLGIPAQGRVSVRVLQDSAETLPGRYRLLPSAVPASVAGDLQPGATQRVPDRAAYASVDLYPAEVARVVETAWLRDQHLARIEIYPFQYLAATGALRWHRQLAN